MAEYEFRTNHPKLPLHHPLARVTEQRTVGELLEALLGGRRGLRAGGDHGG